MTGLGKVTVSIKKRRGVEAWRGQLIGLEWQSLPGEALETWRWRWRCPEVTKGPGHLFQDDQFIMETPKDLIACLTLIAKVDKPRVLRAAPVKVPKPKKAAPKRDKKKTAARVKKNKKNKAAMNPKGK